MIDRLSFVQLALVLHPGAPVVPFAILAANQAKKKADAAQHPKVLHHVGLLGNGPAPLGLPFI
jgi:hypothetical protein